MEYKFIEKNHKMVESFIKEKTGREPFPYFIAVGAFDNNEEFIGIMTIGKPGYNLKHPYYTYAIADLIVDSNYTYDKLVKHFHSLYDGLILQADR